MPEVILVYFSAGDVTGKLMQAVESGLLAQNCQTRRYHIRGEDIVRGRFQDNDLFKDLVQCDGIIFGSPTYMGGPAAQFKAFADATSDLWSDQYLAGKLAAGVTSGTNLNGDQSMTLQYFATLASQHGMLWVSLDCPHDDANRSLNRLGTQLGVAAQTLTQDLHEMDRSTALALGERFGKLLNRWK
ncbi:flavodoxin family protein [Reinekea blandensis]|uniref:Multimeric flavodoxin WrbA n=1 Tax=Reinekea blandensis MED297 TaxID=314283 RepID=A4B8Z7_9GAMM|nr:flavodoxin family protein [Reinekea blandensis]EAR11098.1 multimeric flavodoxin WrbA [Reinekea sp. MED297] [Reinekea blandensis MED297]